ncbi:hypothetical protein [Streptomyces omiyaensis]|uniref:hypothetical protein n=1 Tax=Streptomyces omiyaensis TaxID=68247 RepID=UPI00167BBB17|nr:hypothetical protein [Streptomyces omiyaensis]
MSDVFVRADMINEMARRLGIENLRHRGGPRLEDRWLAAWHLFETACSNYAGGRTPASVEQAAELVRAMVKAHESYQEYPSVGYLACLYDELVPLEDRQQEHQVPCSVEWAARPLEAVRAGLRDDDFARWLRALEGAVQGAVLTAP